MIPLSENDFHFITPFLQQVNVNNLFARSVVEKHVRGIIYTDNSNHPETFHIVHPYGMSLLFGNCNNEAFNEALVKYILNSSKIRNKPEWLQAFPDCWNDKIKELLGDKLVPVGDPQNNEINKAVEQHTRVNFTFNKEKYRNYRNETSGINPEIIRVTASTYETMIGSVVPKHFWNSADDFLSRGIGFCLVQNGEPVSMAYAAYVHDDLLEIGIETREDYRGKGLAQQVCSAFIDYCLENGYDPVWSCRKENLGSFNLALKLGFEAIRTLPYYRLP